MFTIFVNRFFLPLSVSLGTHRLEIGFAFIYVVVCMERTTLILNMTIYITAAYERHLKMLLLQFKVILPEII